MRQKTRRPERITIFEMERLNIHSLSWGLGLQSTCMVRKVLDEELPKPDVIVFADPGWERGNSYEVLEHYIPLIEEAGIPFRTVSGGNIHIDTIENERPELPFWVNASRYETIEGKLALYLSDIKRDWYKQRKEKSELTLFENEELQTVLYNAATHFGHKVVSGEIKSGWKNMDTTQLGRQCTMNYKIKPVMDLLRKEFNASSKNKVGQWLGITTDEISRMKSSNIKASILMYPLIDLGMSRDDCEEYLLDRGSIIPQKSACLGCPYHSDKTWRELSDEEIEDVGEYEEDMIQMIANSDLKYKPYFANGLRVQRHMIPILDWFAEKNNESDNDEDGSPCMGIAGCFL